MTPLITLPLTTSLSLAEVQAKIGCRVSESLSLIKKWTSKITQWYQRELGDGLFTTTQKRFLLAEELTATELLQLVQNCLTALGKSLWRLWRWLKLCINMALPTNSRQSSSECSEDSNVKTTGTRSCNSLTPLRTPDSFPMLKFHKRHSLHKRWRSKMETFFCFRWMGACSKLLYVTDTYWFRMGRRWNWIAIATSTLSSIQKKCTLLILRSKHCLLMTWTTLSGL